MDYYDNSSQVSSFRPGSRTRSYRSHWVIAHPTVHQYSHVSVQRLLRRQSEMPRPQLKRTFDLALIALNLLEQSNGDAEELLDSAPWGGSKL
ncbi:hypothetical protein [Myxacorys almedinensis]|uniref:Uncharacterized protein n=1 Tax=Myxacorys almedinensis A TaxID=2690445 RepID=A0A8J8CJH8_9CYAN|nr:hypothetical protein [Myxacorys almedinensis]NDJ18679.1 hypothetical protein [Myxacorys almedinensis A]